jgi:hypothetical protein
MVANQSLKLTEVAADNFAARKCAGNYLISRYVRAISYMELAIRRRSVRRLVRRQKQITEEIN